MSGPKPGPKPWIVKTLTTQLSLTYPCLLAETTLVSPRQDVALQAERAKADLLHGRGQGGGRGGLRQVTMFHMHCDLIAILLQDSDGRLPRITRLILSSPGLLITPHTCTQTIFCS